MYMKQPPAFNREEFYDWKHRWVSGGKGESLHDLAKVLIKLKLVYEMYACSDNRVIHTHNPI